MKRTLQILISIIILITLTSMMIFNQPRFGQTPKGERLERIKKSANYIDGEFKNLSEKQSSRPLADGCTSPRNQD